MPAWPGRALSQGRRRVEQPVNSPDTRHAVNVASAPIYAKSPVVLSGLIRAADLIIIVVCAMLAYWFRHDTPQLPERYGIAIVVCLLIAAQTFSWFGLYSVRELDRLGRQMARLSTAWAIVGLSLIAVVFFTKTAEDFSRIWAATWLFGAWSALLVSRIGLKLMLRRWRNRGWLNRRVAIIGAGEHGRRLLEHLKRTTSGFGVQIIGIFDDRDTRVPPRGDNSPIIGTTDDLIDRCRANEVDEVVIALPWSADRRIVQISNKLRQVPVDLHLAPEAVGYHLSYRPTRNFGGLPVLTMFERPLTGWNQMIKLLEDRILGTLILLLFAPFMLAIAVAIKLDSPGPVFFRQRRFGFNNNIISVYKFRTMHHRPDQDDSVVKQATREDPRVTRVGAFLRRTSLDELPQFLNVLGGSMSIVGPRPHAVAHNLEFAQALNRYYGRHRVKPGITGWAQVNGLRGETDTLEKLQKRLEHDLYYIDHWSLWLDLKIIAMTPFVGLVHEHAY
jgi:Undecaprenyl-phosphate glucose phosphotransferase